jgi:hypothetical protein
MQWGWLIYRTPHDCHPSGEIPHTNKTIDDYVDIPDLCQTLGHDWQFGGGTPCPRGAMHCSLGIMKCHRCGDYDYGAIQKEVECSQCTQEKLNGSDI